MQIKPIFSRIWLTGTLMLTVLSVQAASLPDFSELAEKVSPAVVNISTQQTISNQQSGYSQQIPELLRRYFGDNLPEIPESQNASSLGSGFILSEDGYILTNNHVIDGADTITVRLYDRRELEAEVIGADEQSDLALLKIDADDLPVLKLADPDDVKVGEWVMAIGAPFGFDYSVTKGIVSAVGRTLSNEESYVPFIQTDVAINPGNSGGPLVDMDGEVIGINSQIYTRSSGFMGISFAIPMSVALEVVDQLKTSGAVSRGWLGVYLQDVNYELAQSFGLKKPAGALVAQVIEDSPAAKGGLESGDIITRFDGKEIDLSSELPPIVGSTRAGEKVKVDVIRNGKEKTLTVTLGELSREDNQRVSSSKTPDQPGMTERLGLQITDLTDSIKRQLGVTSGVVVQSVSQGDGANAGIRRGDVITMVNGQVVNSVSEIEMALDALKPGQVVPLRVVRSGRPLFLPLKIS